MGEVENYSQSDEPEHEEFSEEVVRFFKGKIAAAIIALPNDLKYLPEDQLCDRVDPGATEWELRERFSKLVREARLKQADHIPTQQLYEEIITRQTFHDAVLNNPLKIAFISRPVIDHLAYYNAIHKLAMKKLMQILKDLPPDSKHIPQILRLAESSANRVYGPVVQKMQIQSKNVNVEVQGDANGHPLLQSPEEPAAIQRQIEQLQQKLLTSAKDVTPKDAQ